MLDQCCMHITIGSWELQEGTINSMIWDPSPGGLGLGFRVRTPKPDTLIVRSIRVSGLELVKL